MSRNASIAVYAKYEVKADLFSKEAEAGVAEKAKELLKKALLPALMLMGPVACGTQEGQDAPAPAPAPVEQKAEQQVNRSLEGQGIKCDIKTNKDGGTMWTFTDKAGDSVVLELPSFMEIPGKDPSFSRNEIEVKKEPKSDRMDTFKEAVIDTLEFGFKHVQKKYDCDYDKGTKTLPATEPNL